MSAGITIIQSGRQGGKTHTLVEWVKAGAGRVIVTADEQEAQRLRRVYGLSAAEVISNHGLRQMVTWGPLGNRLAIDNLDIWLRSQFGSNVELVSLTTPVVVTKPANAHYVEWIEPDWSSPDALLEDEDGAPYPEHVQETVRSLRIQLEAARAEVLQLRAKAERDQEGVLHMLGAMLPVPPPKPDVCPECAQGKHTNCDGTTWNVLTDAQDVCPCRDASHG